MENIFQKPVGKSIITNFGCDTGCKYCIWKQHKLKNVFTTYENTDWDRLKDFVSGDKNTKISLSGGGDPFFRLETNKEWFHKLFEICENISIDVHTSKQITDYNFLKNFNRIVIHLKSDEAIPFDYLNGLLKNNKIRLTYVLTDSFTESKIISIIDECRVNDYQVSFRELNTGSNSKLIKLLKTMEIRDNKNYFIANADYNIYFMPDNSIQYKYMY